MDSFYFRKLDAYKNAKLFVQYTYSLLEKFPIDERFALCSQIRRASTSIAINIAEGFGRFSSKEKIRFIEIAYGSLNDTLCELEIAKDMGYISDDDLVLSERQLTTIAKQLSSLRA